MCDPVAVTECSTYSSTLMRGQVHYLRGHTWVSWPTNILEWDGRAIGQHPVHIHSPAIPGTDILTLKRSRYACFGLWVIGIRSLYPPLHQLLSSPPDRFTLGPLKSYPTLTELTRNPASDRGQIEKNWMIFYTSSGESYIHHDLPNTRGGPRGRTFAKLLGNALITPNLTDPLESLCLQELGEKEPDKTKQGGRWHQATNSLRVGLCNRSDKGCVATPTNQVFLSLVHRKYANYLKLPLRYERYFVVWEARPPFHMLGVSKHLILMANENSFGMERETELGRLAVAISCEGGEGGWSQRHCNQMEARDRTWIQCSSQYFCTDRSQYYI